MFRVIEQEYKNPLRWGWYYASDGVNSSKLMCKHDARRYIKDQASRGYNYGWSILIHKDAPGWLGRRLKWPIKLTWFN